MLGLGTQNDAAAGPDQYSLRLKLLSVRNLHGPQVTPKQFVGLFDAATADRQFSRLFTSDIGPLRATRLGGQRCKPAASIKGTYPTSVDPFESSRSFVTHVCSFGSCH